MLGFIFMGISELGLAVFVPRAAIIFNRALVFLSATANFTIPVQKSSITGYTIGTFTFLIVIIFVFLIRQFGNRFTSFAKKLDLWLLLSQLGIPPLFLILINAPVVHGNGALSLFHFQPILLVIIVALGVIAYVDLFVRQNNKEQNAYGSLLSPWILVAILVFLLSSDTGWPAISLDEYHKGEYYLPWWLFKQFGSIPFIDYQPARGLVNYFPGFLSWLFYDGTFSGQSLVLNQFTAMYVFLAFFALRSYQGDFVAFLSVASLYLLAGTPVGNMVIVIAGMLLLLKSSLDDRYVLRSFWLWVLFCILIPLFSLAEGSMFVLGTLPFGVWLALRCFRLSRKSFFISLAVFLLAGGVLVLTTDLGRAILAAVRYLLEESGTNDAANGIPWQHPGTSSAMVTLGYFWQIVRFSWLLVIIPVVGRLFNANHQREKIQDQLFLAALFIACVFLIPRAAGRIDPTSLSRPAWVSIGIVIMALPMVLLPPIRDAVKKAAVILLIAVLFGLIGNQENTLRSAISLPQQVFFQPANLVSGADVGLSNIGKDVIMEPGQLKRALAIKHVLDQILSPQETYYDATSRAASYGFQNRPNPVPVAAIYNASSTPVQLRIVTELGQKKIPLVLISAANILHDGGKPSLRNFVIYQFLLQNYLPFKDEFGLTWMIRKGEERRLDHTHYKVDQGLVSLNKTFLQKQLQGLPAAWGNSGVTLLSKMTNPKDILKMGQLQSSNDLLLNDHGDWQVTGIDPYVVFALPPGVKGDLLQIELDQKIPQELMQVFWTNDLVPNFQDPQSFEFGGANSSKYIIPVSSAPSWLLSNSIQAIRIDFPSDYQGTIYFNKLILYDRVTK